MLLKFGKLKRNFYATFTFAMFLILLEAANINPSEELMFSGNGVLFLYWMDSLQINCTNFYWNEISCRIYFLLLLLLLFSLGYQIYFSNSYTSFFQYVQRLLLPIFISFELNWFEFILIDKLLLEFQNCSFTIRKIQQIPERIWFLTCGYTVVICLFINRQYVHMW